MEEGSKKKTEKSHLKMQVKCKPTLVTDVLLFRKVFEDFVGCSPVVHQR